MSDLLLTLSIIILFVARIGVPVLVLVTLGVLLDHWQSRRETDISKIKQS